MAAKKGEVAKSSRAGAAARPASTPAKSATTAASGPTPAKGPAKISVAEAARKAAKEESDESEEEEEEAPTRRRAHGRRASIVGRPGGAAAQAPATAAGAAPSSPKLEPKKRVGKGRPGVDLVTTQNLFGYTQGFDVSKYMRDYFSQQTLDTAVEHKDELKSRRTLVTDALKGAVTKHYKRFIQTSREIIHIESDLLKLTHMLNDYKIAVKGLQEVEYSYDDERFMKEQTARERDPSFRNDSVLGEEVQLEELSQDLRSLLYERKWEKAVATIEDAFEKEKLKTDAKDNANVAALKTEIEARITQLVDMLLEDLKTLSRKKYERRRIIGFLVRLKRADKALQIFLQNRSLQIKGEVRQINFQGDVSIYIKELSLVFFTAIGSACSDFHRLFQNQQMMSAVIVWSITELENFGHIFQRQLFQSEDTFSRLGKCLKTAFAACTALERRGLSLSFILARMFTPSLLDVIRKNYKLVETRIADELSKEQWKVEELWVHERKTDTKTGADGDDDARDEKKSSSATRGRRALKLTASAKELYNVVRSLLREVVPILDSSVYPAASGELYPTVVQGMIRLFDGYLSTIAMEAKTGLEKLTDQQSLGIVANTYYLSDDLLPRVTREFVRQFGREVPELEKFRMKLQTLHDVLRDSYCFNRAPVWLDAILGWSVDPEAKLSTRYASSVIPNPLAPSKEWVELVKYFVNLRVVANASLDKPTVDHVLKLSIEELLKNLLEEEYWTGLEMGEGGLYQLIVDVKFIVRASGDYVTPKAHEEVQKVITRAFNVYCERANLKVTDVMASFKSPDAMIESKCEAMNSIGKLLSREKKEAEEREKKEKDAEAAEMKRKAEDDERRKLHERALRDAKIREREDKKAMVVEGGSRRGIPAYASASSAAASSSSSSSSSAAAAPR